MHMIELGQDRKIAALRSSVHVHFFLEVFMLLNDDKYYFNLAIKEAKKASKTNNVPVGCIIVFKNKVLKHIIKRIIKMFQYIMLKF